MMSVQKCEICNSQLKYNRDSLLVCTNCATVYQPIESEFKNSTFVEKNSISHNYKLDSSMHRYRYYNMQKTTVLTYILRIAWDISRKLELSEKQRSLLIENARKIYAAMKTTAKQSVFLALFAMKNDIGIDISEIKQMLELPIRKISKLVISMRSVIPATQKKIDETYLLDEKLRDIRNNVMICMRANKKSINITEYFHDLESESKRIFEILTKKHQSIILKNRAAFSILHAMLNIASKYNFRIKIKEISCICNVDEITLHTGYLYRSECENEKNEKK